MTSALPKPIIAFSPFIDSQTKSGFMPLKSLLVPRLRGTVFLKTNPVISAFEVGCISEEFGVA